MKVFWAGLMTLSLLAQPAMAVDDRAPQQQAKAAQAVSAKAPDVAWSADVGGLRARITLKQTHVFNGTPMIATYLHLQNVKHVLNPMKIAWSMQRMKFRVVNAAGKDLRMGAMIYDGPSSSKADLVLPYQGKLSFTITQSGCGVPGDQAALIDLGPDSSFLITPSDGPCVLHAVLEVPEVKATAKPSSEREYDYSWAWHGRIELPPVAVPLTVQPPDAATAGALIDELGHKMIAGNGYESEQAVKDLSLIADVRVIPWYVKALESKSYDLKFAALDRLSRFNSDEAFQALAKCVRTQAGDFENCTPQVAPSLAANIRHSAAGALARSPHPKAEPLLFTLWNSPDQAVQIEVLHVLGRMDTPASLELLKKMSNSADKDVREEAQRYIKLRAEQSAKTPGRAGT